MHSNRRHLPPKHSFRSSSIPYLGKYNPSQYSYLLWYISLTMSKTLSFPILHVYIHLSLLAPPSSLPSCSVYLPTSNKGLFETQLPFLANNRRSSSSPHYIPSHTSVLISCGVSCIIYTVTECICPAAQNTTLLSC